jgi:hypothetical protein
MCLKVLPKHVAPFPKTYQVGNSATLILQVSPWLICTLNKEKGEKG